VLLRGLRGDSSWRKELSVRWYGDLLGIAACGFAEQLRSGATLADDCGVASVGFLFPHAA
jgi:hypothetical protein